MSFIIPAIDIIEGSCVRLTEGVYDTSKVYSKNPLDIAKQFEEVGCTRLHLVDLDGARKGSPCNLHILEEIAAKTSLFVDFSGGLRNKENIQLAFSAGASFCCIGSLAVKSPDVFCEFIRCFGEDRIILSADVRGEQLAVHGWEEQTEVSIFDLIRRIKSEVSLRTVIVTDIAKDGRLMGPSFALYEKLSIEFPELNILASGGVHQEDDVIQLKEMALQGVIVGKAIYEGNISFQKLGMF